MTFIILAGSTPTQCTEFQGSVEAYTDRVIFWLTQDDMTAESLSITEIDVFQRGGTMR